MKLSHLTTVFVPIAIMSVLGFGTSSNSRVFSQTSESHPITEQLRSAMSGLESSSAGDWDKSESVLKLAMRDPACRDLATSSLALLYIKRGNLDAVGNFLRKTHNQFPTPTLEQQNFLLRMQIGRDIAAGTETVSERFPDLVQSALQDKLSKENRLASAAMLGVIIGMLEPDAAQSPIDRKILSTAKDSLLKSRDSEVSTTFDSRYRKAKTHAAALADWLVAHRELSLEEATKVVEDCSERLRVATQDRNESVAVIRLEMKEHRKKIYDLSKTKEGIQKEINAVLFQWNCHPEVHNPIMPDRRSISVRTTERVKVGTRTKRVKKTRYKNGERETYYEDEEVDDYETRPRSQFAINSDIDAIYLPRLNRYQQLKAAGQALIDKKANSENQFKKAVDEIIAENREVKELEERGKEEQADLRRLREEAKTAIEAFNARKSGRTELAFRPPNFVLFDFALETKELQQSLSKIGK